jgi:hypothetical protein
MLPRTAQGLEMGAARIKSRVNKRGPFIGPHKPFSVVVLQELERHRVNIAFKTLSLYSVSGCDIEKRNHSEAIRRAVEHNKRDDASHHVPPGQIRRELSHLNQVLLGPAGVDAVVNLAESTFEEFDIVPPRVDSIVCIETVMFPGSLSVPEEFYAWTNDWIRQKFGPVIASDRHLDQRADHAHTLALPILNGRLAGNELSSKGNRFEIRHSEFLAAAEARFGSIVRKGHDRKGTKGGSAIGGRPQGGFAKGGLDGAAIGGSSNGGRLLHQPPFLRGSFGPPFGHSIVSLGLELAGDDVPDVEAGQPVRQRNGETAPQIAFATLDSDTLAEARSAMVNHEVCRHESPLDALDDARACATENPAHGAIDLSAALTARLDRHTGEGLILQALTLEAAMAGRGWLSLVDIDALALPGLRGLGNRTAFQCLGVLVAAGRIEEGRFFAGTGTPSRGFRTIGPEVERADLAHRAKQDAQNEASVLAQVSGTWTNATQLAKLKLPGLVRVQVIREALDRLVDQGKVERRPGRQRGAWEYRESTAE